MAEPLIFNVPFVSANPCVPAVAVQATPGVKSRTEALLVPLLIVTVLRVNVDVAEVVNVLLTAPVKVIFNLLFVEAEPLNVPAPLISQAYVNEVPNGLSVADASRVSALPSWTVYDPPALATGPL